MNRSMGKGEMTRTIDNHIDSRENGQKREKVGKEITRTKLGEHT